MKVRLEIDFDSTEKDSNALRAIAATIAGAMPTYHISSASDEDTTVTVYASPEKMTEAVENMSIVPGVKVETSPVEPPAPKAKSAPKPKAQPVSTEKVATDGKRLRELLLAASNLEGVTLDDAKAVIYKATGIGAIKDLGPEHAGTAIEALEGFISEKGAA